MATATQTAEPGQSQIFAFHPEETPAPISPPPAPVMAPPAAPAPPQPSNQPLTLPPVNPVPVPPVKAAAVSSAPVATPQRPPGIDPRSFRDPAAAAQYGGPAKPWAQYYEEMGKLDRSRQQQTKAAATTQAREETAQGRADKESSFNAVTSEGHIPVYDNGTQRYYPKNDPATGQPAVQPYSTGKQPDPRGGTTEIKRNAAGEMEVMRHGVPTIKHNPDDPNDFNLYRGDEKIDPVVGLRSPEPEVATKSAAALKRQKLRELQNQRQDAALSSQDSKFDVIKGEGMAKRIKPLLTMDPGSLSEEDRTQVALWNERDGLHKKQVEAKTEEQRIRELPLDKWTGEALANTRDQAGPSIDAGTAHIQQTLQPRMDAWQTRQARLTDRIHEWEAQNTLGVPADGHESHARERADILATQTALDAEKADIDKQVDRTDEWMKSRAREKAEVGGAIDTAVEGAQKIGGKLHDFFAPPVTTAAAAPVKAVPINADSVELYPAPNPAGKEIAALATRTMGAPNITPQSKNVSLADLNKPELAGKNVYLPIPTDTVKVGGSMTEDLGERRTNMRGQAIPGSGIKKTGPISAPGGGGPEQEVSADLAREVLTKQMGDLSKRITDLYGSRDQENAGWVQDFAQALPPGTDEKTAKEQAEKMVAEKTKEFTEAHTDQIRKTDTELEGMRRAAFAGLVPMNQVVAAYRARGVEVKDVPNVEQWITQGGMKDKDGNWQPGTYYAGAQDPVLISQEERAQRLVRYRQEFQDQPLFREDQFDLAAGENAKRVKDEANRLKPMNQKLGIMWDNAWDNYKETWGLLRAAADVALGDYDSAVGAMKDYQTYAKQIATRGEVGASERDSLFGTKGLNTAVAFIPDLVETIGTSVAGAVAGSAAGPGGTVAGGVEGLFAKSAMKSLLRKQTAEYMAKGAAKEIAEARAAAAITKGLIAEATEGPGVYTKALKDIVGQRFAKVGVFASMDRMTAGGFLKETLGQMSEQEMDADPDKVNRAVASSFVTGSLMAGTFAAEGTWAKAAGNFLGHSGPELKSMVMNAGKEWAKEVGGTVTKQGSLGYTQGVMGVVNQRFVNQQSLTAPLTEAEKNYIFDSMISMAAMGTAMHLGGQVVGNAWKKLRATGDFVRAWKAGGKVDSEALRAVNLEQALKKENDFTPGPAMAAVNAHLDALDDARTEAMMKGDYRQAEALATMQSALLKEKRNQVEAHSENSGKVDEEIAAAPAEAQPMLNGVAAVLKGENPAVMTEGELDSLGLKRSAGSDKVTRTAGAPVDQLPDGRWILTDAGRAAVTEHSPALASFAGADEKTMRQTAAENPQPPVPRGTPVEQTPDEPRVFGTKAEARAYANQALASGEAVHAKIVSGKKGHAVTFKPPKEVTKMGESVPEGFVSQKGEQNGKLTEKDTSISVKTPDKSPPDEHPPALEPSPSKIPDTVRRAPNEHPPAAKPEGKAGESAPTGDKAKAPAESLPKWRVPVAGEDPVTVQAKDPADAARAVKKAGKKIAGRPEPVAKSSEKAKQEAVVSPGRESGNVMVRTGAENPVPAGASKTAGDFKSPVSREGAPAPTVKDIVADSVEQLTRLPDGGKKPLTKAESNQLNAIHGAMIRFLPAFGKVFDGVEWTREARNSGGMQLIDGNRLLISLPDMASAMEGVKNTRKWALGLLSEEAIHSVTLDLIDRGVIDPVKLLAGIREGSPEIYALIKDSYRRAGTPEFNRALEFARMASQGRIKITADGVTVDGIFTEQHFTDKVLGQMKAVFEAVAKVIRNLVDYLPGQYGDEMRTLGEEAARQADEIGKLLAEKVEGAKVETKGENPVKIEKGWKAFPESLGIPRDEMPQIHATDRGALANFLAARGIPWQRESVYPASLKASQREFSPEKVAKAKAFDQPNRAILVSGDGHVIDGHHQWQAAMENGDKDITVIRLDAPVKKILATVAEFPSAETHKGETPNPVPGVEPLEKTKAGAPSEAPAVTPGVQFRTERGGSLYTVDENGRTSRVKGASGGVHEGDVGQKERSERTVYVDPETANKLGVIYAGGLEKQPNFTIAENGDITLTSYAGRNADGSLKPVVSKFKSSDAPAVGMHPVELLPGRKKHIGSAITEITPEKGTATRGDQSGAADQAASAPSSDTRAKGSSSPGALKETPGNTENVKSEKMARTREEIMRDFTASSSRLNVTLPGKRAEAQMKNYKGRTVEDKRRAMYDAVNSVDREIKDEKAKYESFKRELSALGSEQSQESAPPPVTNKGALYTPEESAREDALTAHQEPIINALDAEALDSLGERLGVKRKGRNDDAYREAIKGEHPDDIQTALSTPENPTEGPASDEKVKADTPAAAVDKIEERMGEVPRRSQKDIKAELVQKLESALSDALAAESDEVKVMRDHIAKLEAAGEKKKIEHYRTMARQAGFHAGTITIDIPGDGSFKITNNPETLADILSRAKRLPVKNEPVGAPYRREGGKPGYEDVGQERPEDPKELARARELALKAAQEGKMGLMALYETRIAQMEKIQGVHDQPPTDASPETRENPPVTSQNPEWFNKPEEPTLPTEPTGIKNAKMDAQAEALGEEPSARLPGWTHEGAREQAADAIVRNPGLPQKLIKELNTKVRALEPWESLVLDHEVVRLTKAFNDTAAEVMDPKTPEADREALRVDLEQHRTDLRELWDASAKTGSASGSSLNARKALLAMDYSLAGMEARFRKDGKPLTEHEQELVANLHNAIAAATAAREHYEKNASPPDMDHYFKLFTEAFDKAKTEGDRIRQAAGKSEKKVISTLKKGRDESLKWLREKMGADMPQAPVSSQQFGLTQKEFENDAALPYSKEASGDTSSRPSLARLATPTEGEATIKGVFHGTNKRFNEFKRGDLGFHFGTKEQAGDFADLGKESDQVKGYDLRLKNPLRIDYDPGKWNTPKEVLYALENYSSLSDEAISEIRDALDEGEGIEEDESAPYDSGVFRSIRKTIKYEGFDGIVYKNKFEGVAGKYASDISKNAKDSYVVFDANQVKPTVPVVEGPVSSQPMGEDFDPETMFHLAKALAFHMAEGGPKITAEELQNRLAKDVGEWSRAHFAKIEKVAQQIHASDQNGPSAADVMERMKSSAAPMPGDVAELVRAKLAEGLKGDAIMTAVHADLQKQFPEITEREVKEMFTEYGRQTFPSQEELEVQLREHRELVRIGLVIEDLQRGLPGLKSGKARDRATARISELKKKENALRKKLGIEATDPTRELAGPLAGVKRRLTNDIAELNRQKDANGRTLEERERTGDPLKYDDATKALLAERNKLKQELAEIEHRAGITLEDRTKAAEKALDRQIENLDRRIFAGEHTPAAGPEAPDTPSLVSKRAIVAAQREHLREMRETAVTPSDRASKALDVAQRLRDRWERTLAGEEPATAHPGAKAPLSDAESDTRGEIETLKRAVSDMRRTADAGNHAEAAKLDAIERSIAELERVAAGGDEIARGRKVGPESQAVHDAIVRRDAAKKLVTELKKYAGAEEDAKATRIDAAADRVKAQLAMGRLLPKDPVSGADHPSVAAAKGRLAKINADLDAARKASPEFQARTDEGRRTAMKNATRKRIADIQDRISRKDFAPKPKREPVTDPELDKLKAAEAAKKLEFEREKEKARLASRELPEKVLDNIAEWKRFSVLASIPVIGKLTTAALEIMALTPAEDALGGVMGKIPGLREIAKGAPRHGGFNWSAQVKSEIHTWQHFFEDWGDIMKHGESKLDLLYGDPKNRVKATGALGVAGEFLGRIHSALKSPAKRSEFIRSYGTRLEFYKRKGVDISDPATKLRIAKEAYIDANRSIFMEDNLVVDWYKAGLQNLQQHFDNKKKGDALTRAGAKTLKFAAEYTLPVVRIPTNIVKRTLEYSFGAALGTARIAGVAAEGRRAGARLGSLLSTGLEHTSPEVKDAIMRNLKRGTIGLAMLLLGFANRNNVGGYYHGGKKPEDDPDFGTFRIFGWNLPKWLVHNPLLEQLQIGATIGRVMDDKLRIGNDKSTPAWEGVKAGMAGLIEEVPFVNELKRFTDQLKPDEKHSFLGETLKSAIPGVVQQVAGWTDSKGMDDKPVIRHPEGIAETVESGIPRLRQNVPTFGQRWAKDNGIDEKEPYARAVATYNASRRESSFKAGGRWAPLVTDSSMEVYSGGKKQKVELSPETKKDFREIVRTEAGRHLAKISDEEVNAPTLKTMERIEQVFQDAREFARARLKSRPVESLGTVK